MDRIVAALPLLTAPFVGSFLAVLIRRMPRGQGVMAGRSACEQCHRALGVRDLVPILSFLARGGRCRMCGAPIARMHLYVELAAMVVPLCVWGAGLRGAAEVWSGCGLGWVLLALGWIDAGHFWLPDVLTLPLIVAGLAQCWWLSPERLADRAGAAMAGWAGLALVAGVYRRLRGREGLGGGDAKLLAAGGAWVGLASLPWIVLIGAVLGLLSAGWQRVRGREIGRATRLPLGPWLAVGVWVCWLVG